MSTSTDPRTDEQLAADPQAFDTRLAERYERYERVSADLERNRKSIHRFAGDRMEYIGSRRVWHRTDAEVLRDVQFRAEHPGHPGISTNQTREAAELLKQRNELGTEQAQALLAIHQMEAIYNKAPWQRYFPCTNRDGHIHASYRDCPTVRWDTAMAWYPSLSGKTVDEAVADLGPALCSVCFPLAPVEQKSMTLGQVKDERTRAERDAAKAERQAKKDAKELAPAEQFRTEGQYGELVTTVAKCKELVRKAIEAEVELEWINLPERINAQGMDADILARMRANYADSTLAAQRDAGRAGAVLRAREERHPGWGATQTEITKMQQNKYRSARKEWGLA